MIYVTSGTEYQNKDISGDELRILAANGKIFSFKSSDLYAEYYHFNEDEDLECCFKYRYSARSRRYLEAIMRNIGLLYYTEMENSSGLSEGRPEGIELIKKYEEFEICKSGDKWIAQTGDQISYDDFSMIKFYFDHMPTIKEVKTSMEIREFEKNPVEVYYDYSGNPRNWLDLEGSIKEKMRKMMSYR